MADEPPDKHTLTALGQLVRDRREAHGWSQHHLADLLRIPRATLQDLESGPQRERSLALLRSLSQVFVEVPWRAWVEASEMDPWAFPDGDVRGDRAKLLATFDLLSEHDRALVVWFTECVRTRPMPES